MARKLSAKVVPEKPAPRRPTRPTRTASTSGAQASMTGAPFKAAPGPHCRGETENCYACTACEQGDHTYCEKHAMIFCSCYRWKHKPPAGQYLKNVDGDEYNPATGRKKGGPKTAEKKGKTVIPEPETEELEWL